MPEYLTPGIYFEFRDQAPVIRGVRTDIAGFVGLAERGPVNKPVQIDSLRQFQVRFGGFVPYGFLSYAVKGFFENGGRTCFAVRVAGPDAAKATLVLKNKAGQDVIEINALDEGAWGNRVAITLLTRPNAGELSLLVARGGPDRESFTRLSINPDDQRYFARVINEGDGVTAPSQWISASPAASAATDLMPDALQSNLTRGSGFLSGGHDGIASLTKDDFLGDPDPLAAEKKGLSAFDRVDAVAIICVPDIHIQPATLPPKPPPDKEPPRDPCLPFTGPSPSPPLMSTVALEQPPSFSQEEVASVQQAMIEHCERRKDRVAILDSPVRPGGRALTFAEIRGWRSRFDSARGFAALYYPWVKVVDPLRVGNSPVRAVPPCGHIAGLYARTDLSTGVHKAPANAELFWAEDVTASVNEELQAVLNPEGVNCLRAFPGRGIRVYGARTISSDPDWRYVNVRRLMLMLEEAVDEATQWTVFEPHDFKLRQTLVVSLSTFLETVWRNGGLTGDTPDKAFYVKCDESNNPPEIVDQGKLITEVGVAPTHPAEFIVFRVGRTTQEIEIVER